MLQKNEIKTLAVTVGTSMFSNLERIDLQKNPHLNAICELYGKLENKTTEPEKFRIIQDLANHFLSMEPDERLLGAEITSVYSMIQKNFLSKDRERIFFFVSDTQKGKDMGDILKHYFQDDSCKIKFKECNVVVIEKLQDEKPLDFKVHGLSYLVRELGKVYSQWQYCDLGINATGGYKAQIAIAVAFGQVMQIPVFYKHELFDQIISFPRVPFTINLNLIENNLKFWADIAEPSAAFTEEELQKYTIDPEVREEIDPLLEYIEEENVKHYSLSPLGQIYWQRYLANNRDIALKPEICPGKERTSVTFRDDHYPDGFREYAVKVYNENEFIKSCHSLPYHGQQSIKHGSFYIHNNKHIIGEYQDKKNFGARFEIMSNAKNELERNWVIKQLEEWFGRRC